MGPNDEPIMSTDKFLCKNSTDPMSDGFELVFVNGTWCLRDIQINTRAAKWICRRRKSFNTLYNAFNYYYYYYFSILVYHHLDCEVPQAILRPPNSVQEFTQLECETYTFTSSMRQCNSRLARLNDILLFLNLTADPLIIRNYEKSSRYYS
jgi:hypothetical protein